jgi:hypothetical protein
LIAETTSTIFFPSYHHHAFYIVMILGQNFSFYTPANYILPTPPAPAPAAPILSPLVYHAAPAVHHVPAAAQPPMQH